MLSFDERFARTWKQTQSSGGSQLDATLACIFMATSVLEDALARCNEQDMRTGDVWDALVWLREFGAGLQVFDRFWEELKFRTQDGVERKAQWQTANAQLNGIYRSLGIERPIVGSNRRLED